jgi:hypothetical protein
MERCERVLQRKKKSKSIDFEYFFYVTYCDETFFFQWCSLPVTTRAQTIFKFNDTLSFFSSSC